MNRLKSEIADFEVLFEYMEIKDDSISSKELMDELVTGGLKFIEMNDLVEDGTLYQIELD